jgi:hypothetical protein
VARRGSDTPGLDPQFGTGVLAVVTSPGVSPAEEGATFRRPVAGPVVS